MATQAKIIAMTSVHAATQQTMDITVDAPCLAKFEDEKVFHRKYVVLQAGANPIPYFGGKTKCWFYPLDYLEKSLASAQPTMIHDVPTQ